MRRKKQTTSPRPSPPAEREKKAAAVLERSDEGKLDRPSSRMIAARRTTCQWVEGFASKDISCWHHCKEKPVFEVQENGVTLAWVCAKHSIQATQLGYQIR